MKREYFLQRRWKRWKLKPIVAFEHDMGNNGERREIVEGGCDGEGQGGEKEKLRFVTSW